MDTPIDFILFKTNYNNRLIESWQNYINMIEQFNQINGMDFCLYGCFTNTNYPEVDFLYQMRNHLDTFVDTNGCIIIKNRNKKLFTHQTIANLIQYINDFCTNFNYSSMNSSADIDLTINGEPLKFLWMSFNTSNL